MLVSSGGFLDYRAETHFFDKLRPKFGPFHTERARRRLMRAWVSSPSFQRFGLDPDRVVERVATDCRNAGDILRLVFEMAAAEQGADRWAECTPLHLLAMDKIRQDLPEAVFLHVIRDGRDVALSLEKVGWLKPLPWDRGSELQVGGWVWEWQLRKGRRIGERLEDGYHEVRFEALVREPRAVVAKISDWIGHSMKWDQIRANAVGAVASPNSAFSGGVSGIDGSQFDPVFRWRRQCMPQELQDLETGIGGMLTELGYPLGSPDLRQGWGRLALLVRKRLYQTKREVQLWVKENTPLSRWMTQPELEDV